MTTIYGTKQVATIGPRKHITITYPTPREDLLGVPLELPTSTPPTPQVSLTIEAGDLPTLTGIDIAGVSLSAFLIIGGGNLIQTGQNVYIEPFLNGVSLAAGGLTGTSSSALYTWQFEWRNVALGDLFEAYLWTDNPAEVNVDYSALVLAVTQPRAAAAGTVLLDVAYSNFVQLPTLTLGSPDYNNARNTNANNGSANVPMELFDGISIPALALSPECFLYKVTIGDASLPQFFHDFGERPYYDPNMVPTDISWYPTSIRVV